MTEQPQIAQKREQYLALLDEAIQDLADQLRAIEQVQKVILFGSYAAGRRDLFTDLDLIVVLDTDLDYANRTAWLYQKLRREIDLDLLVYTPEEFRLLQGSSFLRNALKTSKVIYERYSG